MSFDKKPKNHDKISLSEPSRLEYYQSSDQEKYNLLYQVLINDIINMLVANKSLFEIYEYASQIRREIAKELKHDNQEYFGVIREHSGSDVYNSQTFANTPTSDRNLFKYVKQALPEKSFLVHKEWPDSSDITQFYYRRNPPPGTKYALYTTYKNEYPDDMYLDIVIEKMTDEQGRTDEKIIQVKVNYNKMSQEIYRDRISHLDEEILKRIKQSEPNSQEALHNVFLLVHAMSRDIYVKRGSAAINGAILRAIARTKGFELKSLDICGLPFDVYAHLTADSDRYARICVAEVGRAYQLFIDPYLVSLLEIERNKIQDILTKFKNRQLLGQSSSWPKALFDKAPDFKEVDELSAKINVVMNKHNYLPSRERCATLITLLEPYVAKTPKAGEILKKALLPIQVELEYMLEIGAAHRTQLR